MAARYSINRSTVNLRIFAIALLAISASVYGEDFSAYPIPRSEIIPLLPSTSDKWLLKVLHSRTTIYYKLPRVWQYSDGHGGLFSASYLPDFNANDLFPWETTFGLNQSPADFHVTVDFLNLPENGGYPATDKGKLVPIFVFPGPPVRWIFPRLAIVGEIIFVKYDGQLFCQEVRARTKALDSEAWEPKVFRPFANREQFAAAAGIPAYSASEAAHRFLLLRNQHEDPIVHFEGLVERLPPLPPEAVKRLLARPFVEITNDTWSPCADQPFHILPQKYSFGLLGSVDEQNCANCHRQTGTSVMNLVPREPMIRDGGSAVGNIRGCDGVFSWYPMAASCARSSEEESQRSIHFRALDEVRGIIKIAGPNEASPRHLLTKFVQESLTRDELPHATFLHTKGN